MGKKKKIIELPKTKNPDVGVIEFVLDARATELRNKIEELNSEVEDLSNELEEVENALTELGIVTDVLLDNNLLKDE